MRRIPTILVLLLGLVGCPKQAPEPVAPPADPQEVAAASRPQTPRAPLPYPTREIAVTADDGVTLAGTLALPEGPGPYPAVLLLNGSGAQDRDETLAGHKPFAVWADHLARAGVASLRMDDRGVGGSGGSLAGATLTTLTLDAGACLDALADQPEVDGERLGLLGHSQGGTVATRTAVEKPVGAVVLLAAPGVSGRQILVGQASALLRAQGAPEAAIDAHRIAHEKALASLDTDDERDAFRKLVDAQVDLAVKHLGAPEPDDRSALVDAGLAQVKSASFRSFLADVPSDALAKLEAPVLAVGGSLDKQVLPRENLDTIRRALDGHPDATVLEFPGLNHLFQHAGRGTLDEYGLIDETVAPEVLEAATDWLLERLGS